MTVWAYLVIVPASSTLEAILDSLKDYGVGAGSDPKSRTRARLLRAATELFQARGYRRTSIDDVARAASVAKGTVYVHFRNKAELLLHAVAEEKKRFAERARPLLREKLRPEERLLRYLELALVSVPEMPIASRIMSGDREVLFALEELAPDLRSRIESLQEEGLRLLLAGVGGFDRLSEQAQHERIRTLYGILLSFVQLMDPQTHRGMSPRRHAELVAHILVYGMRGT